MKKFIAYIIIVLMSITGIALLPQGTETDNRHSKVAGKTFLLKYNKGVLNFIDSIVFNENNTGFVYMPNYFIPDTMPTYVFMWEEKGNFIVTSTRYKTTYFMYNNGHLIKPNSGLQWIQKILVK